jgi:hypothetical protein
MARPDHGLDDPGLSHKKVLVFGIPEKLPDCLVTSFPECCLSGRVLAECGSEDEGASVTVTISGGRKQRVSQRAFVVPALLLMVALVRTQGRCGRRVRRSSTMTGSHVDVKVQVVERGHVRSTQRPVRRRRVIWLYGSRKHEKHRPPLVSTSQRLAPPVWGRIGKPPDHCVTVNAKNITHYSPLA